MLSPEDVKSIEAIIKKYPEVSISQISAQLLPLLEQTHEKAIIISTKTASIATSGVTAESDSNVVSLKDKTNESFLERVVQEANFLPIHFLIEGATLQRSVARVKIPGIGFGTGFMISPSIFITNNHVIQSKDEAGKAEFEFNYQLDLNGEPLRTEVYSADTSIFHTSPQKDLDYTVIRLNKNSELDDVVRESGSVTRALNAGENWGYIPMTTKNIAVDQFCNIIQHPKGRRKEVAIYQNKLTKIFENVIHYQTDTEPGSSGSPVFDNEWNLIALHHSAGEEKQDNSGQPIWISNEGVRIDRIILDLKAHFEKEEGGIKVINELAI